MACQKGKNSIFCSLVDKRRLNGAFYFIPPLKIWPPGSGIVSVLIFIVSASLGHMMGEVSAGGDLCEMTGHKFQFYYDLFEPAIFQ